MSNEPRQLDVIQRWMQAVITHPFGPGKGADSDEAMREIAAGAAKLDRVINPSSKLDALRRIEVYANAYYGRLIECMANEFPVLAKAVGEETFNEFAFGYLQAYPSRSYTLNELSRHLPQYLDETRPDREGLAEGERPAVGWPDFLIDLAKLEWTINEVFDAPGVEGQAILTATDLAKLPPARWPAARIEPVCCLRLLHSRYPVNAYYTQVKQAGETDQAATPEAGDEYVAVFRREYVVRRQPLSRPQFELLSALKAGEPLGVAIERAAGGAGAAGATGATGVSDDELAASLRNWFEQWTAAGVFHRVRA